MKSRSPWCGEARRPGFTLLEVMIASGIALVVMAIVFQAYSAANKAKALTVGQSLLKVAGTAAAAEIYKGLHQSRHLFGRGYAADTFIERIPILPYFDGPGHLSPGLVPAEFRLADIRLKGSFWLKDAAGEANPDFDPDAVGNALFFATTEPKAALADPPGDPLQQTVFGSGTMQFAAMRLHLYALVHRPLPHNQRIRPPDGFVYQLMHFRSQPYVDYRELLDWVRQLKASGASNVDAFIDGRLADLASRYPGALALDANDASQALYELAARTDHLDLKLDPDSRFETHHYRTPLSFAMHDNFGTPMVAFNTSASSGASPRPGVAAGKLDVPAYARDDAGWPFGFEVMIGGPPDRRQVLVRLALAARTSPGNVMVGETFQQVVQVYDF